MLWLRSTRCRARIQTCFIRTRRCSGSKLAICCRKKISGSHPCKEIALLRALTEAAQCRLTAIAGSRDDFFRSKYDFFRDDKTERLNHEFLAHNGCLRHYRDISNFEGETLQDDVEWELRRLESAGLHRVLVVDLTHPEFRIPVARVVIPGLEPGCSSVDYSFGRRARAILEAAA